MIMVETTVIKWSTLLLSYCNALIIQWTRPPALHSTPSLLHISPTQACRHFETSVNALIVIVMTCYSFFLTHGIHRYLDVFSVFQRHHFFNKNLVHCYAGLNRLGWLAIDEEKWHYSRHACEKLITYFGKIILLSALRQLVPTSSNWRISQAHLTGFNILGLLFASLATCRVEIFTCLYVYALHEHVTTKKPERF